MHFDIVHRTFDTARNKIENSILVLPHEDLNNLIGRIKPTSDDEIVIKIVDPNIHANQINYYPPDLFIPHD